MACREKPPEIQKTLSTAHSMTWKQLLLLEHVPVGGLSVYALITSVYVNVGGLRRAV